VIKLIMHRKNKNLGDLIQETLEIMEMNGGEV
jgi:hypothetical protein